MDAAGSSTYASGMCKRETMLKFRDEPMLLIIHSSPSECQLTERKKGNVVGCAFVDEDL